MQGTFIKIIYPHQFNLIRKPDLVDKFFNEMRDHYNLYPDGRLAASMLQSFSRTRSINKVLLVLDMIKQMNLGVNTSTVSSFLTRMKQSNLLGPVSEQADKIIQKFSERSGQFISIGEISEIEGLLRSIPTK